MSRVPHRLDDQALAAALRDAGRTLPGARRDVAADLTLAAPTADRPRRAALPRRSLLIALGLLLVVAGAAVVGGIVPGVELRTTQRQADIDGPPLIDDAVFLGERTSLAAAREAVDFPIRVPVLTDPPQVHVADAPGGHRVSLLYPPHPGSPRIDGTDAGLLVTQFRGRIDQAALRKFVGPDIDVIPVDIDGVPGWWIDGAHEVAYLDPAGTVVAERVRYADRTLLWSIDGVTLRLETAATRTRAIELATSMH
ncbi:hypothetical protein BH23ACT10_BH23ACT10_34210 [soil metagenome]